MGQINSAFHSNKALRSAENYFIIPIDEQQLIYTFAPHSNSGSE